MLDTAHQPDSDKNPLNNRPVAPLDKSKFSGRPAATNTLATPSKISAIKCPPVPSTKSSPIPLEAGLSNNRLVVALRHFVNPETWAQKPGLMGKAMRTFFRFMPGAKLPWVLGAACSFGVRIGLAQGLACLTDSRLLTGSLMLLGGIAISWPIMYTLQRWQHIKTCQTPEGKFNSEKWRDLRKHAMWHLLVQEAGFFVCYLPVVGAVMRASHTFPILYGGLGGAISSVAANGLQWAWQNFLHDKITPAVRKAFSKLT